MQWQFGPEGQAAGHVRREAVRWLTQQGVGPLDDTAVVIAELLANAVRVARHRVCLDVSRVDGRILISVTDDGPGFGSLPLPVLPPLEAEGSRGLYLVRTLSADFAVDRAETGTTVHCSLPVSALAAPA